MRKGPANRTFSGEVLASDTEALDESTVTVDVDTREVAEQTTTTANEQKQSTTRVVVVLVFLEVLGQIEDALGEHGDLNLG